MLRYTICVGKSGVVAAHRVFPNNGYEEFRVTNISDAETALFRTIREADQIAEWLGLDDWRIRTVNL